jgi:hypothetical protein
MAYVGLTRTGPGLPRRYTLPNGVDLPHEQSEALDQE